MSVPVTVAAARTAPAVVKVEPVQINAVQRAAGEPAPELLAAAEETPKVKTVPAGTAMLATPAVETVPGGPQGTSQTENGQVTGAEAAEEAAAEKPKKTTRTRSTATTTRRRTTKKAAEAEAQETPAEGEGATQDKAAEAEAPAPAKRTRTRRKAAATAEADAGAQPAEGAAAGAATAAGTATADSAATGQSTATADSTVAGQSAAGAADAVTAGGEAAGAVAEGVQDAGAAAEAAEEAPARRTRTTRTRTRTTTGTTRRGRAARAAEESAESAPEAGAEAAAGADAAATTEVAAEQAGEAAQGAVAAAGSQGEDVQDAKAESAEDVRATANTTADTTADITADTAEDTADTTADTAEDAEDAEDIDEILPEDEPLDDEPAGEDLDEDTVRQSLLADPFALNARRESEPGTTFLRPAAIFEPLFQAPDPSKAKPAVPRRTEPEPDPADADDVVDETVTDEETDLDTPEEHEEETGGRRRRRRRGGRGRGKSRERDESEDAEEQQAEEEREEEPVAEETPQEEEVSTSRRRRRRRRRGTDENIEPSSDDPPNTVVRIRAPRSGRATALDTATDGVQSVRGSTRLEAKKQRRREGRELGRRRPPIITESEFLARRESVDRMMVVRRQGDRTQIAVLEDGVLVEHYVNREASQSYVGNVYLGKVQNVLPSMEAAFVDIGKGRNAVLYAGEVNFDTAGLEGQPKRIESALKSGQSVLVQVTKDPIGHKGARLTSQISLPGRYLVYVPDGSMTGISRKLPDKERSRLKSILKKVMPENAGVIVRTAAEGASEEELARDVARLSAQWENIQKKAKSASPPELLSAEPDLTIRVVRDVFNEDFTNLVVQGDDAWDTVDEYVKYVAPHLAERLSKWDIEQGDVFEHYRIDEQLAKALERKVWLPSGGSLVIDRTEAMTVVDVNTGKFTGQGGNLEETVTRNNLEAAEEIVRQLRLRDIGGIIVIDFIDMVLESNRDLVLRRLLECLARDRTKHQVAEVTSLGLVQMTRKRVGQGLLEAFSTPCECCNGRGLLISTEPVDGKPEPRGTQGKMAVEKAVAEKVSAAKDTSGRDTVTGALDDVPAEDDQANQTSGRGRRRSRRAKSAE
ncbi:ribonuclease E/G [Nonomuraea sp. NPDC049309]|uniref:Rne/Rng family ribonuclease n=1 Tax=Nonomuraea sp. NPDC049309 TaxID=3364350 RepID=UPI0037177B92